MIYICCIFYTTGCYLEEKLWGGNYLQQWLFLKQTPCEEINSGWEWNTESCSARERPADRKDGSWRAGYLGNLAPAKSLWQLNASLWFSPRAGWELMREKDTPDVFLWKHVPKKDGSLRPILDLRALNKHLRKCSECWHCDKWCSLCVQEIGAQQWT